MYFQAGTSGSEVVEAVVDRITSSCIFPDDKEYLRRLAYVESTDGTQPDTYRSGYHGGIWQVSMNTNCVIKTSISHSLGIFLVKIPS